MRVIIIVFKVMLLVTLILGSIIQTSKLWFEESSDRSFFYRVLQDNGLNLMEVNVETGNMVEAMQLGVYLGGSDIDYTLIGRGDQAYNEILSAFKGILEVNFLKGDYKGIVDSDEVMWENQHFMLVSPLTLDSSVISNTYPIKTKVEDLQTIVSFVIVPSIDERGLIHIYIESGEDLNIYHYQLDATLEKIDNILLKTYLEDIDQRDDNPAYISTRMKRLPFFRHTRLLPVINHDIRYHKSLFFQVPFIKRDTIDLVGLRGYMSKFFDNPDVMNEFSSNNEISYTDTKVVVKYNAYGVVDYFGKKQNDLQQTSLSLAKTLADQFVTRTRFDSALEILFSEYVINEDGSITFYYDMGYNGYPIIMNEATQEAYKMKAPIEVVVQGEEVIKFKKVLRSVDEMLPQDGIFAVPYEKALDAFISENGTLQEPIDKMYLGYDWSLDNPDMGMNWIIEIGQKVYFLPLDER